METKTGEDRDVDSGAGVGVVLPDTASVGGAGDLEVGALDARHGSMRWGFLLMRLGDQAVAGEGVELGSEPNQDRLGNGLHGGLGANSASVRVAQDWTALVSQYEWDTAIAIAILSCESGGVPGVVNSTAHVGLFQISPAHRWSQAEMLVPAANIAAAYELFTRSGWQPWVSSIGCWGGA